MWNSGRKAIIPLIAAITIGIIAVETNGEQRFRRVAGGKNATAGELSFVVRIAGVHNNGTDYICSGAIISSRHILTAGSCLIDKSKVIVYSGIQHNYDGNVPERKVAKIIVHPGYPQNFRNDIAVAILDEPLELGDEKSQNKIALPTQERADGTNAFVVGWDKSYEPLEGQKLAVHKVSVKLLNDEECKNKYGSVLKPEMLCGFNENLTICKGDSGSPLVSDEEIIGIVAANYCTTGISQRYVNVYNYLSWIKSVVKENA